MGGCHGHPLEGPERFGALDGLWTIFLSPCDFVSLAVVIPCRAYGALDASKGFCDSVFIQVKTVLRQDTQSMTEHTMNKALRSLM